VTICSGADRHGLDHDYANNFRAQGQMSQPAVEKQRLKGQSVAISDEACPLLAIAHQPSTEIPRKIRFFKELAFVATTRMI
jgi:hypothetical protein